MGYFTGPLVTEEIGYELWKIVEPFDFVSTSLQLIVPVNAGFICDLASIPPIARSFIPKMGYWSQPGATHDLLYHAHRNNYLVAYSISTKQLVDVSRNEADLILMEGCEAKENEYAVPLYQRRTTIIYAGVVAGAEEYWETPEERERRLSGDGLDDIRDL